MKQEKKKCETFGREVLIISSHKSPIGNITIDAVEAESSTALVRHNNLPCDAEHPYDINDYVVKQQVMFLKYFWLMSKLIENVFLQLALYRKNSC